MSVYKLTDECRELLYKIRDYVYDEKGMTISIIDDTLGLGMYNDEAKFHLNYWREFYLIKKNNG